MAEEKRMNFYRTFYDLTTLLPEAERRKVNTALLDRKSTRLNSSH